MGRPSFESDIAWPSVAVQKYLAIGPATVEVHARHGLFFKRPVVLTLERRGGFGGLWFWLPSGVNCLLVPAHVRNSLEAALEREGG